MWGKRRQSSSKPAPGLGSRPGHPVFAELATLAPVVAYDRAGNGQSPADGQPATPAHIAARLHALLGAAGIPPPYVLVGHSWGGPLILHVRGKVSV